MRSMWEILQAQLKSIANLYFFLPYYFNISVHLRTLFSPWKRLVGVKKHKGFDFSLWLEQISMTLVSRIIGWLVRSILILFFFFVLLFYSFFAVPLWLLLALVSTPFQYLWQQISSAELKQKKFQAQFIATHLLVERNRAAVETWFASYFQKQQRLKDKFNLENLLSVPPIGRDWTFGFTPTLDDYTTDLTSPLAYKNILLGRAQEVKEIERALAKSYEANVVLVGDEGVGKSTIIDGLAQNIYEGKTIPPLQNMRVLELNMEKVISERSTYEEKAVFLEELLQEAALAKNIILVVPDFQQYVSQSLVGDFTRVWAKYGERPLIKLMAVTTPFYYEQVLYHNEKLKNLFNKVSVEEISQAKALIILQDKALTFEQHYHLNIPYESLQQVIRRSQFYITNIPFPEKAITLLDEACVYAKDNNLKRVLPDLIDQVLSKKTHVPVGKLSQSMKEKLNTLEANLKKAIFGQELVIAEVTKAIKRAFIEENKTKPLASFLFLGPTGVGKTAMAKQLAKQFFGAGDKSLRFDMSFYQDKQNLEDLIGSYKHNSPGLLANSIREKPYSVLLIDELEKAHKDILNIFLTLLDEGYLVDGFGEKVDCKNLIFVATSNAGAKEILTWVKENRQGEELADLVKYLVVDKGLFTPEFLNRFDKTIVFAPLTIEVVEQIGAKVVETVRKEYSEQKNLEITVTNAEFKTWLQNSFKEASGAREIERVIRENLANKAAEVVLS